ncbi:MAG: tripartite tricarboxylate transporter substrate binding protein, partial [Telluria sp.]
MSVALGAQAAYPEKPITVVVPFPAGGSTDAIARAIGPKIVARFGQPWIVDNRPGATGAIGASMVKRAAPDGYTIMVASIGVYAMNPWLQKGLTYDPSKDFDLLTVAVRAPNVLVANPNVPVNTVPELIAHLKKNPGKTSFASSGNGSSDHLTSELFWQKSGTSGLHVPYKGGAPAMTDLLGGQTDVAFFNIN